MVPQESKMDPRPDYGRGDYVGSGKLTDMVRSHGGGTSGNLANWQICHASSIKQHVARLKSTSNRD